MSLSSEMDAFKDIPGYKAILKSVLKSQIQLLIEQLADQTGEESIILTASINDGTLSHLGSSTGKGFLEGRDEMKSQFLGYCLKTHHRKKTQETKSPPYQRSNQRHSPYRTPAKQSRVHPVSLQKARSVDNSSAVMQDSSVQNIDPNKTGGQIKQEEDEQLNRETPDFSSTPTSFPSSLQLSHTQTSADLNTSGQGNSEGQGQSGENLLVDSDETSNSATNIKIEPITENDMELEITGVEPGNTSLTQEDWGQGSVGYGSAGAEGDSSVNQSVETSNYKRKYAATGKRGTKRKHDNKTIKVKYMAIMETEKGEKSKAEIARDLGINSSTLSTWLKHVDSIKQGYKKFGPNRRNLRGGKWEELEEVLLDWVQFSCNRNTVMSGPVLLAKAEKIAKDLGIDNFKGTQGWMMRFKDRHGIVFGSANSFKKCRHSTP